MNIQTTQLFPPVPSQSFDWSAVDLDTYYGAPDSPTRREITEQEAIENLKELIENK